MNKVLFWLTWLLFILALVIAFDSGFPLFLLIIALAASDDIN